MYRVIKGTNQGSIMSATATELSAKWCTTCNQAKPRTTEFWHRNGKSWDGWQRHCKVCAAEAHRNYAGKWAARVREMKDNQPCMDCGIRYPYFVLDFDHRPGEVKRQAIAKMAGGSYKWETIEAEIAKCDLVCGNCHRIRAYGRGQANYNGQTSWTGHVPEARHEAQEPKRKRTVAGTRAG